MKKISIFLYSSLLFIFVFLVVISPEIYFFEAEVVGHLVGEFGEAHLGHQAVAFTEALDVGDFLARLANLCKCVGGRGAGDGEFGVKFYIDAQDVALDVVLIAQNGVLLFISPDFGHSLFDDLKFLVFDFVVDGDVGRRFIEFVAVGVDGNEV